MNMTDKLVRQASMCVWIEVMRVGSDTFGDPFSKRPCKTSLIIGILGFFKSGRIAKSY